MKKGGKIERMDRRKMRHKVYKRKKGSVDGRKKEERKEQTK